MKKVLSAILALSTVATMGLTAFAETTQPNRTVVSTVPKITLSFADDTFSKLLLPGETYTFPLYVTEEGKKTEPLKDEHIKDGKLRAELKAGKSAISSIKVEEIDDVYSLEVKTEAGWPTAQTSVEGAVKLLKKTNGQVIGSADTDFKVGYEKVAESALESAKAGEYVYIESSAPVVTTEQFSKLDKYADGDKVTFTNGTWKYEVRVSDQKAVNLLHNERAIKEISSAYENNNFKYVSFPAGPAFDFTGTLSIDVSEDMDLFGGNFFVYRYLNGKLNKVEAKLDKEDESLSLSTKNLGRFVITDKNFADGTVIADGFAPETKPEVKPETTPETTPEAKPEVKPESEKPTTNYPANKPNPNTGATDFTSLAVALSALSLIGAGALVFKKSK